MKTAMLIVAIIAGIGLPTIFYVRSQTKPDIRFTLSDPLRIGQAELGKIWQQITVKNSGKVVAKNIQIKLKAKIDEHQIDKHSEADNPKVFNRKDSFELVYPELPVDGTFKLTFATDDSDQVKLDSISVLHSEGKGIEAFSEDSFKNLLPGLIYLLMAFAFVVAMILTLAWSNIDSNARIYPEEKVLKKSKPFYITEGQWLSSREKALTNVISYHCDNEDIVLSKSYQILRDEPPSYLSPEEWGKLKAQTTSNVEKSFNTQSEIAKYYVEQFLPLLRIERPKNMPETTWIKIQQTINESYLKAMAREASSNSIEKLQQLLKAGKPKEVNTEIWQALLLKIEDIYFDTIERGLRYSDEPCMFIEQQDLKILSPEKANTLKQQAYKLKLKTLPDLRVVKHADAFLKNSKPVWLKEDDYADYKETAEKTVDINKIKEEYTEKQDSVKTKEGELSTKIKKVTSQLEIINQAINESDALDRIEDYSNSFAPGNFKNLKEIATLSKQLKKAKKNDDRGDTEKN